jgi:DNA-binding GntR family transcriptional regulator
MRHASGTHSMGPSGPRQRARSLAPVSLPPLRMTQTMTDQPLGVAGAPSLEAQAYEAVIRWLSRGEVRPGEPLPLRELAKRLGMSRTPLRAAVGRLHEQGLVSYHRRTGFAIAMPTTGDLHDLFDLRIMCETHALRRFLQLPRHELPPEIPRLAQETWDLAGQIARDPAAYPEYSARDGRLHRAFVALPGSGRLADWYEQLKIFGIIFRLGWTVPIDEAEFRTSAREHLGIVAALAQADTAAACARLEAHLLRVRDQTIERLVRAGSIPLVAGYGDRRPSGDGEW